MRRPHRLALATLAIFLSCAAPVRAQETPARPAAETKPTPVALPADATTHHTLKLGGGELSYTATAGTLPLRDDKGEKQADIFYVAFTRDGSDPQRPITYAFNGGPGAASAYLDIGALGPRVLDFGAQGKPQPAIDHVVDNPDTWLAFTDLVFVDPDGTGFSRAASDDAAKKLWQVQGDLDALAQIIRLHLTRADRLSAPVYLVGESYGGFRAARLAHLLADEAGIAAQGVMLISPAIEFRLMSGDRFDLLPWALALPSFAAVELETQQKLSPEALREAEHFALGDFLVGLAANPEGVPPQFYARIAEFTGLDAGLVARWRGRVPTGVYLKEMRRGEGEVLSRYDGAVAAPDPNPGGRYNEDDPVLQGSLAPYTRAFTAYARDELGFATDLTYHLLSRDVGRHWQWRDGDANDRSSIGAADTLARALSLHPQLRVLIAHGLTDLTTPYMMSRYVVDHLPSNVTGARVSLKLYPGGHMMYMRAGSRRRLHDDALAFYGAEPAR
jgi:carboxypeptidase C (cathepsin A)